MREISQHKPITEQRQPEIERAQAGDQTAMHQLYTHYMVAMLNTSFRILNNKEDAEDALQEAFIKAFSSLHQFNYQSTFGAWLKRIVVNHSIDQLKKKRKVAFTDGDDLLVMELPAEEPVPENNLQEKLDRLYQGLHQLPDGYRTVLSLYLLEGYDHTEISEILNIEVSTSISQLSRAKKKLKSLTVKGATHG